MFFKLNSVVIIFLIFSETLSAQRLITGRILELNTKSPIDQVDISVYKGIATTTSNNRGYFQLTIGEGDSLLITHPEYKIGLIAVPKVDVFVLYLESLTYYPAYLDGPITLYKHLQKNLKYPRQARNKKIEGWLCIELKVDSVGNLIECKALNDIGGNCVKETVDVFQKIPGKWSVSNSAKYFIFPVLFKLDFKKKQFQMPDIDISHGKLMEPIIITAATY